MTNVNMIEGNATPEVPQNSAGLLDRLLDWMNNVVDALFGPAVGDARHDNPAAAYLFLNPSCCGAVIDSNLWDLLTDEQPQREIEEVSNV